jgi:hypothetical protein
MDRLRTCMDTVRSLAQQSANPNCYLLAEREIREYLESPKASLQELRCAMAETSQHYLTFWTTMQEFVSTLRPDETEQ